jgi:phage shock protein C
MSETKVCPYCAEEVRIEAIKCKHCGSFIGERRGATHRDWTRSSSDRMLGGVCGGVASILGLPTAVVRLIFVIGAFFGWPILAYVVLWIVMPVDRPARASSRNAAAPTSPASASSTTPGSPRDASIERELGSEDPRL